MSYESYINQLDGNGVLTLTHRWMMGDADLGSNPDSIPDSVDSNDATSNDDDTLTLSNRIFPSAPKSLQSNGSARVNLSDVTIGTNDFTYLCQVNLPDITTFPGIVSTANNATSGEITPLVTTSGGVLRTIWSGTVKDWSGVVVDDEQPYFLALVGDRSANLTIYVNGVASGTLDISGDAATSITWVSPRFYDRNNVRLPSGSRISDVQFWIGALTSSEVSSLYLLASTPTNPLLTPGARTFALDHELTYSIDYQL